MQDVKLELERNPMFDVFARQEQTRVIAQLLHCISASACIDLEELAASQLREISVAAVRIIAQNCEECSAIAVLSAPPLFIKFETMPVFRVNDFHDKLDVALPQEARKKARPRPYSCSSTADHKRSAIFPMNHVV
jgi:hypothetical protein